MTTAPSSPPTASLPRQHFPLRDFSAYDNASFNYALSVLLQSPRAALSVPVSDLLDLGPSTRVLNHIKAAYKGEKPSFLKFAGKVALGTVMKQNQVGTTIDHVSNSWKWQKHVKTLSDLITCFTLSRPVLTLTEQEKGILKGMGDLAAHGHLLQGPWQEFLAKLVWNGGTCLVEALPPLSEHAKQGELHDVLRGYLGQYMPPHPTFLAAAGQTIATAAVKVEAPLPSAQEVLHPGARWMTPEDLATSKVFTTVKSPTSLQLGVDDAGNIIYYNGNEALITIGGPGTGKSQAHVVANLLRSPGSMVVLDVKDNELWVQTAEYRRRRWGPVYRFAPTDENGNTNRYNPFDLISTKPNVAAHDCHVFSYQVILQNPKAHDPYWENKGRDFVWAYAMLVALTEKGEDRSVESLYRYLSYALDKEEGSDILDLAMKLVKVGMETDMLDLVAAGKALQTGVLLQSKTLEAVLDTARSNLSAFAKSTTSRKAMSGNDWKPEDLRTHPGSTLYICMPSEDLQAYGAFVRILLAQHLRILQKHKAPEGEVPITFMLDEMPQLGNFQAVTQMQDLGRSAGLRLWMFAQYMGQLKASFGERATGVIDACRVRCFMQPDNDAVRHIEPALGETRSLFSGEKKPLATAADLMGRAYGDKIITVTRGDQPMALRKVLAYKNYKKRMLPPLAVKRP